MKRIRPRTTILGGAAIGLVAGVAMYTTAATSTVSTPVVQPAAFSPVSVAKTPEPEPVPRPKKAPCKKSEKLVKGVCVVHVEKVVVRYKATPEQIQAMPQSQPRAAAPVRNSSQSERRAEPRSYENESEERDHEESESREHEGDEHEGEEHEDEGGDDD